MNDRVRGEGFTRRRGDAEGRKEEIAATSFCHFFPSRRYQFRIPLYFPASPRLRVKPSLSKGSISWQLGSAPDDVLIRSFASFQLRVEDVAGVLDHLAVGVGVELLELQRGVLAKQLGHWSR